MAVDVFLKIGDIKGESTDSKHKDEIEIESFSFGQAADATEAGQRPGKVDLQDFSFVMPLNAASPTLMTRCADGKHIADALLTVRTASGQNPQEFMKIKFVDVLISSFQNGGSQADIFPTDQFSMWFAKIELDYRPQSPTGALGPSVFFKWDRIKGETYP